MPLNSVRLSETAHVAGRFNLFHSESTLERPVDERIRVIKLARLEVMINSALPKW